MLTPVCGAILSQATSSASTPLPWPCALPERPSSRCSDGHAASSRELSSSSTGLPPIYRSRATPSQAAHTATSSRPSGTWTPTRGTDYSNRLPSFPLRRGSSLLFLLRGAFAPVHFYGFHSPTHRFGHHNRKRLASGQGAAFQIRRAIRKAKIVSIIVSALC